MRVKCVFKGVLLGMVWLGTTVFAAQSEEPLRPEKVFFVEEPDAMWRETYAALEGDTLDEKSNHAMTTVDMLAVSQIGFYQKEQALAAVGMELYRFLPEYVSERVNNPRTVFLKTHRAWREYIKLQAEFIADTSGGGTAYSLYFSSILQSEMDWRIALYKEILAGKNVAKHSLYFYECKQGR